MPNTAIYINGQKIDLAEAKVAVTFQVNDVAELEDRQSNFTNEIKVPFTANNKAILENAELPESAGTSTKNKLPAKIVVDGVEIVSGGFAVIESADTHYNITIYSGIAGFFEALGDTGLQDLDLSEWVLEWNLGAVKFLLQNKPVNGYLHAVFEYGQAITNNNELYPPHLLPMFYVHTLVAKIFSSVSQLYESSFFDSAFFKSLALPLFGKSGADYILYYMTAIAEAGPILAAALNYSAAPYFDILGFKYTPNILSGIISDQSGRFALGTSQMFANFPEPSFVVYTVPTDGVYNIQVELTISGRLDSVSTNPLQTTGLIAVFYADQSGANNGLITDGIDVRGIGNVVNYQSSINESVTLQKGMEVAPCVMLRVYSGPGPYNYTINYWKVTITCEQAEETDYGLLYPIEPNLPSISCKDFLKNLAKMFALVFYQNPFSGKMEIRRFDEIYENLPYAKDWSDKLDERKGKSIDFEIGSYGQRNRLTYRGDDYVPEKLNDGYFTIEGNRLEAEKTVVELAFSGCNGGGVSFSNKDIPHVKVFDDSDNIPTNINGRIVSIYDHTLTSTATLDDGIVTPTTIATGQSVPIARFNQWEGNPNLAFKNANANNLTDTYYAGIARMLNRGKKVSAYFNLTLEDITGLDHFTPVYVNGNHYYINKVVDFIPGQLTKVELIQL